MGILKLELVEKPNYSIVNLPDLTNKDLAVELKEEAVRWLGLASVNHVLNFESVLAVDSANLAALLQFIQGAKKSGKNVYSLHLKKAIQAQWQERGVLFGFRPCNSLEEIEQKTARGKPMKVDANVLRPFIDGATKAFEIQIKMPITAGKVASKNHLYEESDAVIGQVEVQTEGFQGRISICFSEPVFKAIYEALLGEKIEVISEESADAAGELINMIYAYAKTALNQSLGLKLKPALPKILVKPGKETVAETVLCIPFSTSSGNFRLEIMIL